MSAGTAQDLVIVNTGCANISSLKYAVERMGYAVQVSDDTQVINGADKVFLPGVGAAAAAMQQIAAKGLLDCLKALEQPVLGICLGMQLLTQRSEEGDAQCLGLIPAQVKQMRSQHLRLPHMGWNQIKAQPDSALFADISPEAYFYFVHGFAVSVGDYTLATCDYSQDFSAAIAKDNVQGVQFHPERSGKAGEQLIRNFIENL